MDAAAEVLAAIPHRPPFLFVDAILEIDANRIVTQRAVRVDEDFFKGHYPGNPLMPGVLICEAMFQSGALLLCRTMPESDRADLAPVLTRIREVKFKAPVRPGDMLRVEVTLQERLGQAYFMKGQVSSGDKRVASAEFAVALLAMEAA